MSTMSDVSIHFLYLKLVPKLSTTQRVNLNKIFKSIVECSPLEVDEPSLLSIIVNDLSLNVSNFDKRLVNLLVESLIYYMAVWPGWQRNTEYRNGDLHLNDWFEKYRMYLIYKCNFVMKRVSKQGDAEVKTRHHTTQTPSEFVQIVAPYTILAKGPPAVLNNIVFMEHDGNVLIKQHVGKPWEYLTPETFFNWPYVSVEINLPDLSIKRVTSLGYERFIALRGTTMIFPEINHISHINKLDPNMELQPYSYNFIQSYISQLNEVLKEIPEVCQNRLKQLEIILSEFLKDIEEINVYDKTMSTNACVGFRIGGSRYIRNRKTIVNPNAQYTTRNSINFYEVINPQVDLSLMNLHVMQDLSQENVSFESLNDLLFKCRNLPTHDDVANMRFFVNSKGITYGCTMCNINFDSPCAYQSLLSHFNDNHKSEQPVLCYKCRKQFSLKDLAKVRWAHSCNGKK